MDGWKGGRAGGTKKGKKEERYVRRRKPKKSKEGRVQNLNNLPCEL